MLVQGKDSCSNYKKRMFSVSNKMIEKVCRKMLKDKIKKAFPWDNAYIESFHSLIKREWLNHFKIGKYCLVFE